MNQSENNIPDTASFSVKECCGAIKKQALVVVLGMHRSGTSAITRGLKVLGVELGEQLLPAMAGVNAKGFWEDADISALNTEMLQALGKEWHSLSAISAAEVATLQQMGYTQRAAQLLQQKAQHTAVFGFKDPRVAKLLVFWQAVFKALEWEVGYVLTLRNPLSVAKSLAQRDQFDPEESYLLWLEHVLCSLAGTVGERCVVVEYDGLMHAAEHELQRVADTFALAVEPSALRAYQQTFLDTQLQHSVYTAAALEQAENCPALVVRVYAVLQALAADKLKLTDPTFLQQLKQWSAAFETLQPSRRLVDAIYRRLSLANKTIVKNNQDIVERDALITQFNGDIVERDALIGRLTQNVVERDSVISHFNADIVARDALITRLNEQIVERDTVISKFNDDIVARDALIARLNQDVIKRDTVITKFNADIVERDALIARLNEDVFKRDQLIALSNQAIVERDTLITRINKDIVERDKVIAQFKQDIVKRDALITQFNQDIVERDALITRLNHDIVERDTLITKFNQNIVERDALITRLNQEIVERDALITKFNQDIVERDALITKFNQNIVERDALITRLNQDVVERDACITTQNEQRREQKQQFEAMEQVVAQQEKRIAELERGVKLKK